MWNVFIVDDQTPKGRVDICLIDKVENLDIARKNYQRRSRFRIC